VEAELVVVGAGPAGSAAVMMAAGLGLHTTLVEADRVGGKLWQIGALANVPGGWRDSIALGRALSADITQLRERGRCTALIGVRAVGVRAHQDRAETALEDGRTITSGAVVVATGVTSLTPEHVTWIEAPGDLRPAPLWRAAPEEVAAGDPAVVLGADRPLGTWLRAHPDAAVRLDVLHPPHDAYKTAEVAHEDRVRLHEAESVTVTQSPDGFHLVARRTDGRVHEVATRRLYGNIGSRPALLDGDLISGPDGYCPPAAQHPRIHTAGDLRSARYQRIVTAQGSGAEAVLSHYYTARGLTV
jgi:thioredoxin reductase (NADPH)/alkyl hydroperoxide reductase subunit F